LLIPKMPFGLGGQTMARTTKAILVVALATLWAAEVPVSAQVTTGTVYGTIKDVQGGVLPGATLVLTSATRGTKSAPVVTNATGDYVFPNVSADTYTLEVTMSGFKTLKRTGVAVSAGDRVAVPVIALEVGGQSETIDVKGEALSIQSQSGERSFTVTTQAVENLPIQSRSFFQLALFAPGMTGSNTNNTNIGRLGGGGSTNFLMDGIGLTDTGSNTIQLLTNVDSIAEVKVLTGSFQAEYGRASGLQILAVTKSGTNRFRGSMYEVKRNSDWNANSWVNVRNGNPKTTVKQDDWGYTLGGPVGKPGGQNKLFFFFAQEWRPRTTAGSISRFRLPTALERQGDFSQTLDNNGSPFPYIRDYTTGLPCVTTPAGDHSGCFQDGGVLGRIPAARLNAFGVAALNFYPLPNSTDSTQTNYTNVAPSTKSHSRQDTLRGDYQLSPNLRMNGKIITQDATRTPNSPDTRFGNNSSNILNGFNDVVDWVPLQYQVSTAVNYSINPSTFLEIGYGFFRNDITSTVITPNSNINNTPGLKGFPFLFPNAGVIDPGFYAFNRLTSLGPDAAPYFRNGRFELPPSFTWGGRTGTQPTFAARGCCFTENLVTDVTGSVTKVKGRHTAKAGVFYEYSYKPQDPNVDYRGTVNFSNSTDNPLDSQFGFANAALGIFSQYSQASRYVEGKYLYQNMEGYLQDNWKVNSKVTLDYGLRLAHMTPQYDANGFTAQFFEEKYNPAQSTAIFRPVCVSGATPPCTGNNLRALNPRTGEILGPGSLTVIGNLVPGSGNLLNGVLKSGDGENPKENYKWSPLVLAPRFGIAYDVGGNQRFVLRGGGGLYYDRSDGNQIFGQSVNPTSVQTISVRNSLLTDLAGSPLLLQAPPSLTMLEFDTKIPTSAQWNGGVQMTLPWSSTIDVEYVGNHNYNQLLSVNINTVPLGSTYLPQNQDPTKVVDPNLLGAAALATDFMRPFQGYSSITRRYALGYNNFHSLQTSWNRRFSHGLQFTVNYTLSRNMQLNGGGYTTRDSSGNIVLAPANKQAFYNIANNDRTHTVKAYAVWQLPGLRGDNLATKALGLVVSDWQLSSIFTGGSGAPYGIGYSYQNGAGNTVLTGSPDYGARIKIVGDPGKGCSSDPTRQFNTAAFQGPSINSNGLESGQNYMRGCPDKTIDLAVARNIRLGGARAIQLRAELFNAFNSVIITGRSTTMNIANLQTPTVAVNLPYDVNGVLVSGRDLPRNAGFGVANNAANPRNVQLQVRFQF
jgi:hypothetical protein